MVSFSGPQQFQIPFVNTSTNSDPSSLDLFGDFWRFLAVLAVLAVLGFLGRKLDSSFHVDGLTD